MKRLAFGSPLPKQELKWMMDSLREIERASIEDIETVVGELDVTGTVTETRTLDVDTATATDIANFLATFISDVKKRGQKRSYAA